MASFHPHYLTFTHQTYHHPVHRFRSWPTQTTSHPHTHTSMSTANKYIQSYLHKVFAWTKQNNLLLNKKTCTLFTPDPCRLYEQSGPNNKPQSTTHGNAPKGTGSYPRPKTHIHNISVQSTQTSTNHKSTHCNRMGKTEGDTHGYL